MFYYEESPVEGEDASEILWVTDNEKDVTKENAKEHYQGFKLIHPTGKPGIKALVEWINKHQGL